MSFLAGYYSIGLKALDAARFSLSVAGNNIANATTPGFSRRRVGLESGFPVRVRGGQLDQGVDVAFVRRAEDRFLQAALQREKGRLGYADQTLRGLRTIEQSFGTLDSNTLLPAYSAFSNAFAELAADPSDAGLRRNAVSSSDVLAGELRLASQRLDEQRRNENATVAAQVTQINDLARELADLNREIRLQEADGSVASGSRDRRDQVVEELTRLTGGRAGTTDRGDVTFALEGGPSLVTAEAAVPLVTSTDFQGFVRIASNGLDLTDSLRSGELGGVLGVRDDSIPARRSELDSIAFDLITRANSLTKASFDLDGNPGGPLFEPDPPPATGAASIITVSADVAADPSRLAVSPTGAPGDGAAALEISKLEQTVSAFLGFKTPRDFLSDALAAVGGAVAKADVNATVSRDLVDSLTAEKQALTGVSLDEEAVALIQHQRAYEAAARFMQVLNSVTEITVNLI